ncbi:MAG: preprotein translocase subunit SecA [Chitinophagales bacterium]|nr:preprotein translocase subunit SecA [Chitinophagales bacterium]
MLKAFVGDKSEKDVKAIQPIITKIKSFEGALQALSHDQLRAKTAEFKAKIQNARAEKDAKIASLKQDAEQTQDIDAREDIYAEIDKIEKEAYEISEKVLNEILPEAFAVVKETARRFKDNTTITVTATPKDRELSATKPYINIEGDNATWANSWDAAGKAITWDMIHYDVQLIGGVVLHQGKIAEMQTGEGKTLVSTLPSYLNALAGLGVHLITVNNYLAVRDCEWNAPLFNFLGLRVDCIDRYRPHSIERINAYKADITYGTNNEFGFDYLRDNMLRNKEELVQGKLHYAMIDEVDSVLIDDARTPLIISGQVDSNDEEQFYELKPRISKLVEAQKILANKFLNDAKKLIASGSTGVKRGEGGFALLQTYRALPKNKPLIKYLSEQGVKQILQKTENHYMQDQSKEMVVVDEDLYFVIEEKQNTVELKDKGIELITAGGEDKDFFVVPDVGSKIADIDKSSKNEHDKLEAKEVLLEDFAIKTERLHTIQQLLKAYTLFEKDIEYVVMDDKVKIVDENTGRIMDGRRFSDGLHQALEAKESVKVEAASQTMATITLQNFFRMYHKLSGMTGTAETESQEFWDIYKLDVVVIPTNKPIQRNDMDDLIYRTTREKFNGIADEIQKLTQAGRPVLVGTTNVEVSEIISRMLQMKGIKHQVLNAKQHQREADIVAEAGRAGAVTIATNMAGRGTDIKLSPEVIKAGGLAIIGSERHDARRIDRQLRGRAGRQGDPGTTQFFISLEDKLMRLFGSENMAKWMDRLGFKEGEVIQHSMITKNVETAQKKVEENNFGVRKRLLEYDDVMNMQREVIYKKRRNALFGERLSVDILDSMYSLCEELVADPKKAEDYENFKLNNIMFFGIDANISEGDFKKKSVNDLTEMLFIELRKQYKERTTSIGKQTLPVLQQIFNNRGETVKNIAVPFTDNKKDLMVITPLEKTLKSEGKQLITEFEKQISLGFIDDAWKHHLRRMDDLKKEVQNASLEQKDPLLIYKLEAFNLFKGLASEINRNVVSYLMKANIKVQAPENVQTNQAAQKTNLDNLKTSRSENEAEDQREAPKAEPVRSEPKVGRNEPCPCGSGKKYKNCHGNI